MRIWLGQGLHVTNLATRTFARARDPAGGKGILGYLVGKPFQPFELF
jgi:hypothetical protein